MIVKVYRIDKIEVDGSKDMSLLISQTCHSLLDIDNLIHHTVVSFLNGKSSWGQVREFSIEVTE